MDTASGGQITWHTGALPRATKKALDYLAKQTWLKNTDWYLAGGTALALQTGHRVSLDLDFFTPQKKISADPLIENLSKNDWITDILKEGTVYGRLYGAKISFIAYPFFQSRKTPHHYGTVKVLDVDDIAVMKIIAISQRGKKRDFVDLYWLCKHGRSLKKIIQCLPDQYPTVAHDYYHILKSLTFFDDAESDPMPRIFFKATWKEIKKFFQQEVTAATRELLGLSDL